MFLRLTKGKSTIINDEDYDVVKIYKWHSHLCGRQNTCYATTNIPDIGGPVRYYFDKKNNTQRGPYYRYKILYMHVLLMSPEKGEEVDHINHCGLDNRRHNLRNVTKAQNQHNSSKARWYNGKKTSSIYKGVTRHTRDKTWRAKIQVDNRRIYLGQFKHEEEAAKAYDIAAKKYFGEHANTNY